MEYVDGITLHGRIQRARAGLPVVEALAIFRAVVEAITYLHERGILQRDIKSSNIKLSSSGQIKLLDFGIANDPSSKRLTMAGGCIGTMDYLAPEQIRGKPADARADVWSLGVLFYEMLTANTPFAADSVGVLCERISRAEYPTPTLALPMSDDLQRIIRRCLRSNASERYHDACELLDDLKQIGRSPPAQMVVADQGFRSGGVTDPIADYLTSIRNAQQTGHRTVEIPASKMKKRITELLYDHGDILKYKFEVEAGKKGAIIKIALKYDPDTKRAHHTLAGKNKPSWVAQIF